MPLKFCTKNVTDAQITAAERLIDTFFENFIELYGENSQSFNFHTMRHLGEQVRRKGSLWNHSAFGFESGNHHITTVLAGTIKNPEKLVKRFFEHQSCFARESAASNHNRGSIKILTKLHFECVNYLSSISYDFYFGRYKNGYGIIFASHSYSRLTGNLGNAIVQLKNRHFLEIFVFVSQNSQMYAIGKLFEHFPLFDMGKVPYCQEFFFEIKRKSKIILH